MRVSRLSSSHTPLGEAIAAPAPPANITSPAAMANILRIIVSLPISIILLPQWFFQPERRLNSRVTTLSCTPHKLIPVPGPAPHGPDCRAPRPQRRARHFAELGRQPRLLHPCR